MRKHVTVLGIAAALSLSMGITAFAGQWKENATGWWYENEDGSYLNNGWNWIDGKCYYFNGEGYMLADTTTPDGYTVDASGAWVKDGVVQVQQTEGANNGAQTAEQTVSEAPNVEGTYVGSGLTCVIVNEGNGMFWVELSGLEKDYLPNYVGNGAFEIPGYLRYTFSGNSLTVEYLMDGEVYHLEKQ